MKGRRAYSPSAFDLSQVPVPLKYEGPRMLRPEKMTNLESLLPFMLHQAEKRAWFADLILRQKDLQTRGMLHTPEEDTAFIDPDDDLLDYAYDSEGNGGGSSP